jgi:SagB-type dehydrogenase family enzyme
MSAGRRDIVLLAALAAAGCSRTAGGTDRTAAPGPSRTEASTMSLPPPSPTGTLALEQALATRHSVRSYAGRPLGTARIGQLFWAAQGITHGAQGRPAPSAGALYPLQLYAVTGQEILRYLPEGHRAQQWTVSRAAQELARASGGQAAVRAAPTVLVIAAVPARTAGKYGSRAVRYIDLEAGHAAQNILLQAVATGLAAVPIGSFDDDEVAAVLGLTSGEVPRYLIPVGFPA